MKGWELLKEISEGNVKEGTKVKAKNQVIYVYDGFGFKDCDEECMNEFFSDREYATLDFEIIEEQEEINIQDIEELTDKSEGTAGEFSSIQEKINELLQAVKQLDNKIKESKNND